VWAIVIFYVVSSLLRVCLYVGLYLGTYPLPDAARLRIQSVPRILAFAISILLPLCAAIWLWLLRREAFELFIASFCLSLIAIAYNLATGSRIQLTASALTLALEIGVIIGVGFRIIVCVYVWRLRQRGLLV